MQSKARLGRYLLVPVSLLASAGLFAQSPEDLVKELEELLNTKVTVASKTAESLNEAPGIITVVSRLEIEGYAAQNLGQVLNRVVGMALLSPDIFPKQSLVVRGQETTPYNNHILVLMDGRPMRDPITGGLNGSYWNSFPLAAVDRLEIIRGPGSVLYGSCAYSGVVNIITRTREDEGTGGAASVGLGSNGAFTQSAHVLVRTGSLKGVVGVTEFLDDGPRSRFVDYNGTAGSGLFFHHSLGAVAHFDYQGVTLNAYQGNYDPYSLEGGGEAWVANMKGQQLTTHLDTGYGAELNDQVQVGANLTYNRTAWITGERTLTPVPLYPQASTEGHALLLEATVRIRTYKDLNIILGGGGEKADWGGGLVLDGSQTSSFLYGQMDYRLQALKLIGGLQYNKLENVKGNVSPRLGLIYDFNPVLGAKLLYSTAFRKGYPNETGFNHPVFRGNPELQPELIDTLEGQLFYQGKRLQGTLTYYRSQMKDLIGRQMFANPAGPAPFYLKYLNGGSWDFQGLEAEGRVSLSARLLLTGSATYQTNRDQAGLDNATLHPNTTVKAGFLFHANGWSLGVFDLYTSAPHPTTLVNPSSAVVNKVPGSSQLLSAKASWKAWERGSRSLNVALETDNALDQDMRYPDYPNKAVNSLLVLNPGRTITGSINLVF